MTLYCYAVRVGRKCAAGLPLHGSRDATPEPGLGAHYHRNLAAREHRDRTRRGPPAMLTPCARSSLRRAPAPQPSPPCSALSRYRRSGTPPRTEPKIRAAASAHAALHHHPGASIAAHQPATRRVRSTSGPWPARLQQLRYMRGGAGESERDLAAGPTASGCPRAPGRQRQAHQPGCNFAHGESPIRAPREGMGYRGIVLPRRFLRDCAKALWVRVGARTL